MKKITSKTILIAAALCSSLDASAALVWSADFESYDTSGGATALTINSTGNNDTFSSIHLKQVGANTFSQKVSATSALSAMSGNALQVKMINTSDSDEVKTYIRLAQHNLPSLNGNGVYVLSCDISNEGAVKISSMSGYAASSDGDSAGSSSSSYDRTLNGGSTVRYTLVINQSGEDITLPAELGTLNPGKSAAYIFDGTRFCGLGISTGVTRFDITGFSAGHNRSKTIFSGAALTVWYDNFGVWNSASDTVNGTCILELAPGVPPALGQK